MLKVRWWRGPYSFDLLQTVNLDQCGLKQIHFTKCNVLLRILDANSTNNSSINSEVVKQGKNKRKEKKKDNICSQ